MNKFQKAGLAIAATSSMVFAAGSLWGPSTDDFPSLQVKTPSVLACWAEHSNPEAGNPCYTTTGGWWFGYTDQTASIKVKLNGSLTEFGDGVALSDDSDGSSLIGNALEVQFETGAAASSDAPTISGIGFSFNKPESGENITSKQGYCITYTADAAGVQFELGWDEATYNYDTWYVELPASSSKKTLTMKWGETSGKQSGDFKKDGWGTSEKNQPSSTATDNAWSVKIRLKNSGTSAKTINFALYELGWANDGCSGGSTPVVYSGAELVKFNLVGRAFSLSSVEKPVAVQVINLQGAVVSSQTLAPNEVMNLSNLPTGIYMIRVPSVGYTSKVILK